MYLLARGRVDQAVVNTFGFCVTCSSETLSVNPRLQTGLNDFFTLFSVDIELWEQEVTHKFDSMYRRSYPSGPIRIRSVER